MKLSLRTLVITLSMLTTGLVWAQDIITGSVLLDGIASPIIIETNIETAKTITLEDVKFKIDSINASSILASNKSAEIEIFIGNSLKNIVKMNKKDIASYFKLNNGNELDCKKQSKAFIVVSNGSTILGNCVNK